VLLLNAGNSSANNDRGVIYHIMTGVFKTSQETAHTWQVYLIGPARILLVILMALVLSRLVTRISARLVGALRLVSPLVRSTPRGEDRVRTLSGVFASLLRAVIWIIAILTVLGQLDINLVPFVATATVIGAAVGFGAQSLVKDFLSGALILAEDQFGVGDHIVVGSGPNATTGTVESVNLRVTRLRSLDGVVWYVPNGDIRTVGNDTENDSQALVDIVVPHGTDLDRAGAVAEDAARDVAHDPQWEGIFVSEPVFAGVQSTDQNGAVIRVMAWTRPGQHFRAARELRLRVLEALRQEGVAWADGAA
jgi:moderate conductance mechanosensitive channel